MSPADHRTTVVVAQVHAYERNHPCRPWIGTLQGPPEVTGDQMVAAMDAVGVDGTLPVSPWSMDRFDASYALEVYARHPDTRLVPDHLGLRQPFEPPVPAEPFGTCPPSSTSRSTRTS